MFDKIKDFCNTHRKINKLKTVEITPKGLAFMDYLEAKVNGTLQDTVEEYERCIGDLDPQIYLDILKAITELDKE